MSGAGAPLTRPVDCSDLRVAVVAASWHETVMEGLDSAMDAFRGLFTGANTGKMLVKL